MLLSGGFIKYVTTSFAIWTYKVTMVNIAAPYYPANVMAMHNKQCANVLGQRSESGFLDVPATKPSRNSSQ